ncbi:MAG: cysteine hydrolase [Oscillospiraceae bacterium]|nr:cysteine hydrolase [Oscillospiraceae bacterium]
MKKFLVVVDIQNDFVSGALGTGEAEALISGAAEYIRSFDGEIFVTLDTHFSDYLKTAEGEKLPVEHCIKDSDGWRLDREIEEALSGKNYTLVEKVTFGSVDLPDFIKEAAGEEEFEIELIGLCTDICVVSNALILKANFPESEISVIERLCAGVTPEKHKAAIETMRSCQINIR